MGWVREGGSSSLKPSEDAQLATDLYHALDEDEPRLRGGGRVATFEVAQFSGQACDVSGDFGGVGSWALRAGARGFLPSTHIM